MSRDLLLFDGGCCFCSQWARRAKAFDLGGRLETVDFRKADLAAIDPRLSLAYCEMSVTLLERGGRISKGFAVFQRLSLLLPPLWPAAPLLHIPGFRRVGEPAYEALERLRFRLQGPH